MAKGSDRERQAVSLYQRAGYATYRPATVRFGENDIFGLFDLLAVKPSDSRVRAVQVKSNRAVGIDAWSGHTALWRRLGWDTAYLVPYDNEGWRLIRVIGPGEWYDAVDEREMDDVGSNQHTDRDIGDGLVEFLRESGR